MTNHRTQLAKSDQFTNINLEHFKSIYYLLNAKPDSQIKILEGKKVVEYNNLIDINNRIITKLRNHSIDTSITTIDLILDDKDIYSYSYWAEFEKKDWNTVNSKIKHISIAWDINLTLPGYELPQRHTLKLKIGDSVPPKDYFQLIFSSDNETELLEARADAVCKVDFINQVLAIELLNIIDNWYNGLSKVSDNKFIKFISKWNDEILGSFYTLFPVFFVACICFYIPLFERLNWIDINDKFFLVKCLVGLFLVYKLLSLSCRFLNKSVNIAIGKFKPYHNFLISRGDKIFKDELEKEQKTLLGQIKTKLYITIALLPLTILLKILIDYLLK